MISIEYFSGTKYREDFMKLIIGLGNPGKEYAYTRHNIGFMVVDMIAESFNISSFKEKFNAYIGEGKIGSEKILLVKPQTYMNASGESVVNIVRFYKVDLNDIVVIYDDLDLELGRLRIRNKGSAGGHNGMKSIIYQLQSDEFSRLRVGIGKPPHDAINHVLGKFKPEEQMAVTETVKKSVAAVELLLSEGIEKAMNKYNEKG